MTESDNFLSRWSRRKHEVAKESAAPAQDDAVADHVVQQDAASKQPVAKPDESRTEPLFDLSKLPSLDSIGPDTDMRLFMQPGVPSSLSHAALRRAWSADPAIRDFIGLSENSWDFTAPNSITGFGPLLPTDDVKQLLAQVFREDAPREAEVSEAPSTALQQAEKSDERALDDHSPDQAAVVEKDSVASARLSPADGQDALRRNKEYIATQQNETQSKAETISVRRRHGGALPT